MKDQQKNQAPDKSKATRRNDADNDKKTTTQTRTRQIKKQKKRKQVQCTRKKLKKHNKEILTVNSRLRPQALTREITRKGNDKVNISNKKKNAIQQRQQQL